MFPVVMIGVSSILGSTWWILSLFSWHDATILPILKLWPSVLTNWSSAAYLATWIVQLLVSVVELACWMIAIRLEGDPGPLLMYSHIAYYGSLTLFPIPLLLAIVHIITIDNWTVFTDFPTTIMILASSFEWLFTGLIHLIFVPRLVKWGHAKSRKLQE